MTKDTPLVSTFPIPLCHLRSLSFSTFHFHSEQLCLSPTQYHPLVTSSSRLHHHKSFSISPSLFREERKERRGEEREEKGSEVAMMNGTRRQRSRGLTFIFISLSYCVQFSPASGVSHVCSLLAFSVFSFYALLFIFISCSSPTSFSSSLLSSSFSSFSLSESSLLSSYSSYFCYYCVILIYGLLVSSLPFSGLLSTFVTEPLSSHKRE